MSLRSELDRIRSWGAALIRGVRNSRHHRLHTDSSQMECYLYLISTEQTGRFGSPEQLTEAVFVVLLKETALKRPQPVRIVHLNTNTFRCLHPPIKEQTKRTSRVGDVSRYLVAPPGHRGDNVSTGRVPLDVRRHVVLCNVHHDAVGGVHKGKSSVHTEHTKGDG